MRIFQIVWDFERFGGLEHHLAELAVAQAARGGDVRVFTEAPLSRGNAYVQRLRDAGIPVSGASPVAAMAHRMGSMRLGPIWRAAVLSLRTLRWLRAHLVRGSHLAWKSSEEIIADRGFHPVTADLFRRLDAAVAEGAPDVVHVHGTRLRHEWVVTWAASRGIPSVYTEHVTLHEWGGVGGDSCIRVMRYEVGALACVSERSRASILAVLGSETPVAIVRHIVASEDYSPLAVAEGALRLLAVARLEHVKGIDVLLHAVARARAQGAEVQLTIAGDGTQRRALASLAQTLGLADITFLGAVPPHSVGALLRDSHVMILPSRGEGLPVALVEAMANGRPAIATRTGGIAEVVVAGETGLLVDADDADQLAAAIAVMAGDRLALVRMGAGARHAWETGGWTPDAVLAETDVLYASAHLRTGERTSQT